MTNVFHLLDQYITFIERSHESQLGFYGILDHSARDVARKYGVHYPVPTSSRNVRLSLVDTLVAYGSRSHYPPNVTQFLRHYAPPQAYNKMCKLRDKWTNAHSVLDSTSYYEAFTKKDPLTEENSCRVLLRVLLPVIGSRVAALQREDEASTAQLIDTSLAAYSQLAHHVETGRNLRIVSSDLDIAHQQYDALLLHHRLLLNRHSIIAQSLLRRLKQTTFKLHELISGTEQWILIITPWYAFLSDWAKQSGGSLHHVYSTLEKTVFEPTSSCPPLPIKDWHSLYRFNHLFDRHWLRLTPSLSTLSASSIPPFVMPKNMAPLYRLIHNITTQYPDRLVWRQVIQAFLIQTVPRTETCTLSWRQWLATQNYPVLQFNAWLQEYGILLPHSADPVPETVIPVLPLLTLGQRLTSFDQAYLTAILKAGFIPLHDASSHSNTSSGWRDWLVHVQGCPQISLSSVQKEELITFYRATVQKLKDTTHTPPVDGWFTTIDDAPFTEWGWHRISLTAVPHAWAHITLITEDGTFRFRLHDIPPLTHPNVLMAFTWLLALAESVRHADTTFIWGDDSRMSPLYSSENSSDNYNLHSTGSMVHRPTRADPRGIMRRPTLVRGHIRDLKGKTRGPGRQELAAAYDIVLPTGHTFVIPHPRGVGQPSLRDAAQTWTIKWSPHAMIHTWRHAVASPHDL
ncbi:MAG: hypothetical protein M1318_08545 [Firmicutes bacterium]|nr:hypothetical protein [Bacillota bacterium]